ncbi:2-oxopent-4-enoate hydratase [Proteobacteria bacterium 005FR1]|nr:2-oxopent-4-enoate hydratase [Proteobacteria bacterium 005FR1]
MKHPIIESLGDELFDALQNRKTLPPLTMRHPGITIEEAYRISLRFLSQREALGQKVVGKKIGVTSKAVQEMLDVHQPDFGFLTDAMHVASGSEVSMVEHRLIQPRAEGEIAFILAEDLNGPGIKAEDVLAATESVTSCFEIVDSRIENWQIKIQDTVADNASCGVFALGKERVDPRSLNLAEVQLQMWRNREPAGSGLGSAVQGHPCEAVAWLANTLGELGIPFRKGEIILSGALAPLVPVQAGDQIEMTISGLGSTSLTFTD